MSFCRASCPVTPNCQQTLKASFYQNDTMLTLTVERWIGMGKFLWDENGMKLRGCVGLGKHMGWEIFIVMGWKWRHFVFTTSLQCIDAVSWATTRTSVFNKFGVGLLVVTVWSSAHCTAPVVITISIIFSSNVTG